MQNQKTKQIIPVVRYHPTIQAASPVQAAPQVEPRPPGGPKNSQGARRPARKPVQRPDPDPDPDPPGTPDPDQVGLGLDRQVVDRVEVLTRGQRTNPEWFRWRKNRITASVAHQIAHCRFLSGKSKAPPPSSLAAITGEQRRVQTRAMSWGVEREAMVVHLYQRMKSAALGRPVLVQDCGLFLDARRSWLAASPDGIVTDGRTGERLLCLEVKCPYKHRQRRVEDACRDDRNFCLDVEDGDGQVPVYRLKRTHSYFTQVQCQLAVTGLQQADFVVFTLKETAVVPVTFDPDFWEETASKLEQFYRTAVLPLVRGGTQPHAAEL